MNKIKSVIWLLLLLLFPANVYAMTGGVSITCSPSQVRANETVTCTISGTSDEIVSAVEAQVAILNSNLTITSFTKNDSWQNGELNNSTINVSTENSTIRDSFTIGTLSLKAGDTTNPESIKVTIQNVQFTDGSGNKFSNGIEGGFATISIEGQAEPQVTTKGLKSLDVIGGILSPTFSASYTGGVVSLAASTTSFGIVAVANNDSDQIVCRNTDGDVVLDCGNIKFETAPGKREMNIHIEVGEGDNFVSYGLNVIKETPTTIDPPKLVSLTIGGKEVNLELGQEENNIIELGKIELENVDNYQISFALNDEENYYVSPLTNPTYQSGERYISIDIYPKDNTTGLRGLSYHIQVVKAGGEPSTQQPTEKPIPPSDNPKTGGITATVMAIILVCSLGASIFLYQKNINGYNN